jgi:hypothetical protein
VSNLENAAIIKKKVEIKGSIPEHDDHHVHHFFFFLGMRRLSKFIRTWNENVPFGKEAILICGSHKNGRSETASMAAHFQRTQLRTLNGEVHIFDLSALSLNQFQDHLNALNRFSIHTSSILQLQRNQNWKYLTSSMQQTILSISNLDVSLKLCFLSFKLKHSFFLELKLKFELNSLSFLYMTGKMLHRIGWYRTFAL